MDHCHVPDSAPNEYYSLRHSTQAAVTAANNAVIAALGQSTAAMILEHGNAAGVRVNQNVNEQRLENAAARGGDAAEVVTTFKSVVAQFGEALEMLRAISPDRTPARSGTE